MSHSPKNRLVGDEALRLDGVGKAYGAVRALADVSVIVPRGAIVGIVGENGAGKTTVLSIIAGVLEADGGTVSYGPGSPPDSPGTRRLGFAPQALGVYPTLTVAENLRFFGELEGLTKGETRRRTAHLMAVLDLTYLADRRVGTMSGGEQRRVHVAGALIHEPPLVVLDEPTVGMDLDGRTRLLQFLRELANAGTGICFSSHVVRRRRHSEVRPSSGCGRTG